jgi:hypothetical protein
MKLWGALFADKANSLLLDGESDKMDVDKE